MDEIRVRMVIAEELGVGVEQVTDCASFADDLGADSLDLVELTMRIEEALDIAVSEDEAFACGCVGDAIALFRRKRLDLAA
ncbi:MAG: acyl carrier protein [Allosphingosinicella sp.]